ncbi:MAG TPA: hypothetical protein DEF41_13995 [Desulfovibrio sp.]|uniref:Uncharacterized protein n=1 Tax=Nitratidesulfovibrio vulgaris (strain ATCC 29579 / DSM 644 / CCUG 34227 / NCIMB 8303 / VKM B-1760 / Hildenborough) TaxID=882 RepID=Q72FG2_NITV2|nr:hypothetical protein DVU_0252 [Nitratidesulfovibrio vulgaris str. Hildenborough]HBW17197.1 hypothetical protein [Desulfovibrio sp.]
MCYSGMVDGQMKTSLIDERQGALPPLEATLVPNMNKHLTEKHHFKASSLCQMSLFSHGPENLHHYARPG